MPKKSIGCWGCKIKKYTGYMVKDNVWNITKFPTRIPNIFVELCIPCLEKMIGRNLKSDDFTDANINCKIY